MSLERINQEATEVSEGLNEAVETGEGIAEVRERQAQILEGVHVPEEGDMETVRAAMEGARREAREDYETRAERPMHDLESRGEGLEDEASEGAEQTAEGARQMEQAADAAPYGASEISGAMGSLERSEAGFREAQEQLRAELERQRARADAASSRI